MKMTIYISILLSVLSLFACEKDEPKDNKPPDTTTEEPVLDVVWKQAVYDDTMGAYFHPPKFAGDYVVFCSKPTFDGKHAGGLVVYDKQTGERHPAWDHEPEFDVKYSIKDFEVGGENRDVLFVSSPYKLFAWDLNTGNELWTIDADHYFDPEASSFGNYFFQCITPKGNDIWSAVLAIDVKTGDVKEVFRDTMVNNYEFHLYPPSVTVLENNDTLLIFQKRAWNFGLSDGKVDIYAYNMTADSVLWKVNDITQDGNSSVMEGIITGNRYLFQGSNSIRCLDIQTGDILWEDKPGGSFFQQKNLYAEGKVFLNTDGGFVYCYDVNTGSQLWANKQTSACPAGNGTMGYYRGRLYLTAMQSYGVTENWSRRLKCFSAYTGEVLYTTNYPSQSSYAAGVLIDEKTGYLYATNMLFALCINLRIDPLANNK